MENELIYLGFKLINDKGLHLGIEVKGDIDEKLIVTSEALLKYAITNDKRLIKEANGSIVLLFKFNNENISIVTRIVNSLQEKYSSILHRLILGSKIRLSFENAKHYKMNISRTDFEEAEFKYVPVDYEDVNPETDFRTSTNIQHKNNNSHIIGYELFPPTSEKLSRLYEKYLELEDLGKLPKKAWFSKLNDLIQEIGEEEVITHLEEVLSKMVEFQNTHNIIERKIKEAEKSRGEYKHFSDFVTADSYENPPTHYYFYTSSKGRYLKGLINTVRISYNESLLNLLNQFALDCPFQSNGLSQAPTGLYIYDILDIFAQIKSPQTISALITLGDTIKQKRPKKKISTYLENIALSQGIEINKLYEKYAS